eukprot:659127-Prorocentrum_lima.AAC.1
MCIRDRARGERHPLGLQLVEPLLVGLQRVLAACEAFFRWGEVVDLHHQPGHRIVDLREEGASHGQAWPC